jgi:hypothetical protein
VLRNDGNAATLPGTVSLIDVRTNEVIWSDTAPVVGAGVEEDGTIVLEDWPAGTVVDIRLEWDTQTTSASIFASFTSSGPDDSTGGLAFDWTSLVYGLLVGLVLGLVARTAMRARAGIPLVGSSGMAGRPSQRDDGDKIEVACPACDQRLRVPSAYTGSARCPACTITFPVVGQRLDDADDSLSDEGPEGVGIPDETLDKGSESVLTDSGDPIGIPKPVTAEEYEDKPPSKTREKSEPAPVISRPEDMTATSNSDVIRCPDCSQKLKVPYDRRPVKARCPACKCEFRAFAE